jgi:opacity protein-like surface antigen
MKLRSLTIGAAAALAVLTAPQIAAAAWGTVTASALNVRSCASVDCATVTAIPAGARVRIDAASGNWYRVTYNGVAGYAWSRYISTGAEITVTGGRTTPVSPEVFQVRPLPAPPPPFGYAQTDGHIGTWYQVDSYYHDSYRVADPAILFGLSIGQ